MRNRAAEIRTTTDTPGRCSSPCKYARLGIRHTHRDARETISGPAGNRLTPRSDLRVRYKNYSPTVRSSTPVSRSDIRLIQYLDSSVHGLVRRWLLIGSFPIPLLPDLPPLHSPLPPAQRLARCGCRRRPPGDDWCPQVGRWRIGLSLTHTH